MFFLSISLRFVCTVTVLLTSHLFQCITNLFTPLPSSPISTGYGVLDKIDLWVGGLAEDHSDGAMVGDTIKAVLVDQFTRLRDGDRFWYENDPDLRAMVTDIEKTKLSDIIERNTGVNFGAQKNVFIATPPADSTTGSAPPDLTPSNNCVTRDSYYNGDTLTTCERCCCSGDIKISTMVDTIGIEAFKYCRSLTGVEFPTRYIPIPLYTPLYPFIHPYTPVYTPIHPPVCSPLGVVHFSTAL